MCRELIDEALSTGRPEPLEKACEQMYPPVRYVVAHLAPGPVEDIDQRVTKVFREAVTRVWRADAGVSFRITLAAATHTVCREHPGLRPLPDDDVLIYRDRASQALMRMVPNQREMILLSALFGLSGAEIAEVMHFAEAEALDMIRKADRLYSVRLAAVPQWSTGD